jgi:murein DD-endopeptidase MepM/ murein hydrolase activator NlpD
MASCAGSSGRLARSGPGQETASVPVSAPSARRLPTSSLGIECIPSSIFAAPLLGMNGQLVQLRFHLNIGNPGLLTHRLHAIVLEYRQRGALLSRTTLAERVLRERLRPVPWVVMRDAQSLAAAHRLHGALGRSKGDTLVPPRSRVALTEELLIVPPALVPDALVVRVLEAGDRDEAVASVERGVEVRAFVQKTALRLPVEGRWLALEGHRFDEHHGDSILESQNFAYDFALLGQNLSTFTGDPEVCESYPASGRPVVAAAAGVVADLEDGVAENVPVGMRPTWESLLSNPRRLAGNFVVIAHEAGEHTAYLHLRPGLLVRKGERVRAGQSIGKLGNSGNSLEPHLHFQLQDGPDLFRAAGLPARFGDFTVGVAHLSFYVPRETPMPLPSRLAIEAGRSAGARPLKEWFLLR